METFSDFKFSLSELNKQKKNSKNLLDFVNVKLSEEIPDRCKIILIEKGYLIKNYSPLENIFNQVDNEQKSALLVLKVSNKDATIKQYITLSDTYVNKVAKAINNTIKKEKYNHLLIPVTTKEGKKEQSFFVDYFQKEAKICIRGYDHLKNPNSLAITNMHVSTLEKVKNMIQKYSETALENKF